MIDRRHGLALAAALALAALPGARGAMAQAYPDRTIQIVHNYGPGTASDATARVIAGVLAQRFGQSVIVDNRSGASGVVGTRSVASAAPDGYTLMIGPMTAITAQPHLVRDTGLSPDGVAPVCNISANILGAAVRADSAIKDGPTLVAAAKRKPLDFGTAGPNSLSSLAVHKVKAAAGGDYVHVPYRADGPSLTELLAGRLDFSSLLVANGTPMFRAGTLRLIGVFAEKRHPEYPEVPTFREQGIDAVQMSYAGMIAPKGTPEAILERLEEACKAALDSPEFKRAVEQHGIVVDYRGRKEFARLLTDEHATLGRMLRELGVQPQ